MSKIRVTKAFKFEMAHALYGYDGPCKNIHGHSYQLFVCLTGKIIHQKKNPKNGMVIDFSLVKQLIHSLIIEEFDHALLLNAQSPHKSVAENNPLFDKIVLVDYQPTCENMVVEMVKRIQPQLPSGIELHHLCLKETATSSAEWYATDNQE